MARTKQTARKSTGGTAHRRQIATSDSEGNQDALVSIFNSTDTRTIAVDGEDSFNVLPDEVNLSFKVFEESVDFHDAMKSALTSLSQVRAKIISLGISNDKITSDSLGMNERVVLIRDGVQINESDVDDIDENDNKKVISEVIYSAVIIVRIQLEEDSIKLFGKVMLEMFENGIYTHSAPDYTTSKLTEYRNESRRNAIENASVKAQLLLEGLGDPSIQLGLPITINDIPQNITDDSYQSFSGNSRPWYSKIPPIYSKKTIPISNMSNHLSEDQQISKKSILNEHINDLFMMPSITINACVKVIFEILINESQEEVTLLLSNPQQVEVQQDNDANNRKSKRKYN